MTVDTYTEEVEETRECRCGKPVVMKDEQWVHAANGQVDCYNAAMYVGYVATPKEDAVTQNEKPMVQLVVEVPQGATYHEVFAALRNATRRVGHEQRVPAPNGDHMDLAMYVGNGAAIKVVDAAAVMPVDGQAQWGRWFVQAVENEENEK